MGWTKASGNRLLWALIGITTLAAVEGWAQAEPMWRVINTVSADVVPPYAGEANPFPMRVDKQQSLASDDDSEGGDNDQRQRIAEITAELKDLLTGGKAFKADLSRLAVSARLKGKSGDSVLINNRWMKAGESLTLPVRGADRYNSLLEELKVLDVKQAGEIKATLEGEAPPSSTIKLKIAAIRDTEVELTEPQGQKNVLPFVKSRW